MAIGPGGEVYEPDGKGHWQRRHGFTTSQSILTVGRAGDWVVAAGKSAVYRLAPNGWTALRFGPKGDVVIAPGSHSLAAVDRQLFSLEQQVRGEPEKRGRLPETVVALGAGPTTVALTARGLYRIAGSRARKLPVAVTANMRPVGDRWAIWSHGALDLATSKKIAWPGPATVTAVTVGPQQELLAVASGETGLELITVRGTKIHQEPVALPRSQRSAPLRATAVAVVTDRSGQLVIALADGTILSRADPAGGFVQTVVTDVRRAPAGGPGAATSR